VRYLLVLVLWIPTLCFAQGSAQESARDIVKAAVVWGHEELTVRDDWVFLHHAFYDQEWTEMRARELAFDVPLSDTQFTLSNLRNPRQCAFPGCLPGATCGDIAVATGSLWVPWCCATPCWSG
jgi:hypothetical protein